MSGNVVSHFIRENLQWAFLAFLVLNMVQRKHQDTSEKKRFGTLYLAMMLFSVVVCAIVLIRFSLPDLLLIPYVGMLVVLAWRFRPTLFPFTLRCVRCGSRLSPDRILFHDANLCAGCVTNDAQAISASEE